MTVSPKGQNSFS